MFALSHHPTAIGITDGVGDAWNFLRATWRRWLPAVGFVAACTLITYSLVGRLDPSSLYHVDDTGRAIWNSDALSKLPAPAAARFIDAIASAVGGWFFCAIAIAGLRNRPVTLSGVIARGLVTVVSGLVIVAVAFIAVSGITMVAFAIGAVVPALGVLLLTVLALAALPAAVYLLVRLSFTALAIFDGFGPLAGLEESWRLTKGSVSRILGWWAVGVSVTFVIAILVSFFLLPFSDPVPLAVAEAAAAAVTVIGSGFVAFMFATLYESERARRDPTLFPVEAWAGYGSGPAEPHAPGPYPARPYTPGPYTAGPYSSGPRQPEPQSPESPDAQSPEPPTS